MARARLVLVAVGLLAEACARYGVNCPCLPSHASLCTPEQLAACRDGGTGAGADAARDAPASPAD